MTLQLPVVDDFVATRSEVRWMSPAAGLWVGSRQGEHAGMVERLDGSYHARSARGRALGSFQDLDSALAVIDGGVDDPQGAPRGVRAMLWVMIGGAAASAFGLALALLR
jgi:3',5'-cyclic AMP phosphodiesterase CpdA